MQVKDILDKNIFRCNIIMIRKLELKDIEEVFELLNELYKNKIEHSIFIEKYKESLKDDKFYNSSKFIKRCYYIFALKQCTLVQDCVICFFVVYRNTLLFLCQK